MKLYPSKQAMYRQESNISLYILTTLKSSNTEAKVAVTPLRGSHNPSNIHNYELQLIIRKVWYSLECSASK